MERTVKQAGDQAQALTRLSPCALDAPSPGASLQLRKHGMHGGKDEVTASQETCAGSLT